MPATARCGGLRQRPPAGVDPRDDLVAQVGLVAAGARRVEELAAAQARPAVDVDDDGRCLARGRQHVIDELRDVGPERLAVAPHVDLPGQALDDVDGGESAVGLGVVGRRGVDVDRAAVRVSERVAGQRLRVEGVLGEPPLPVMAPRRTDLVVAAHRRSLHVRLVARVEVLLGIVAEVQQAAAPAEVVRRRRCARPAGRWPRPVQAPRPCRTPGRGAGCPSSSPSVVPPYRSAWIGQSMRPAEATQAQGVRHHAHARQGHGPRRQGGIQGPAGERVQDARRDGDERDVVAKGPDQVLADDPHRGPRQTDAGGHSTHVLADQGQVAGLDRHVGPGPDRDPEVCLGKGRRVVDARRRPSPPDGRLPGARPPRAAFWSGRTSATTRFGGDADGGRDGLRHGVTIAGQKPRARGRRPAAGSPPRPPRASGGRRWSAARSPSRPRATHATVWPATSARMAAWTSARRAALARRPRLRQSTPGSRSSPAARPPRPARRHRGPRRTR